MSPPFLYAQAVTGLPV